MGNNSGISYAKESETHESYNKDNNEYKRDVKEKPCNGNCNGKGYESNTTGKGYKGNTSSNETSENVGG